MSRANLTKSHRAATQHLFRHLDDASELQRNPIVKQFFATQPPSESETTNDALVAIRAAIRNAAGQCEREDLWTGRKRRARRDALLFEQFYTRGEKYRAAAHNLGLSIQQYYRDKARLCLRITSIILNDDLSVRPVFQSTSDLVTARLGIAEQRFWIGDFEGSLRLCQDIATHAPIAAKVRALCINAAVQRERGCFVQAKSSLDDAAKLLKSFNEGDATEAALARCQVKVGLARLTFSGPRSSEALEIAKDALKDAPAPALVVDPSRRAMLADILIECSEQYEIVGDFNYSSRLAVQALECASSLPPSFPQKSYATRVELRHQWFAPGFTERHDVARRIDASRHALELACASGSLSSMVLAELDLMAVYSITGHATEALERSKHAFRLAADFGGRHLVAYARLSIVDTLLNSPNWRAVGVLLTGLESMFTERSHDWIFARVLVAAYLAKIGQFKRSLRVASDTEPIASSVGQTRLVGALQRLIASSADAVGRKSLAQERIRACLDIQKRNGSLISVYNAYKVAASIMGEARYDTDARELMREIAR